MFTDRSLPVFARPSARTSARLRWGAWALAGACMLSGNAWAQANSTPSKGERQAEIWFNMVDTNRDGFLTWDEVKNIKPLAKEFKAADVNGTGKVSREDIRALSQKRLAERRARKAQEAQGALAPASAEAE